MKSLSFIVQIQLTNHVQAAAVYQSLDIQHETQAFYSKSHSPAHRQVYDFVEEYFGFNCNATGRIRTTNRAPIYFQQPGHSLTIIGLERHKDGSRTLLVFDPGFPVSQNVLSLVSERDVRGRVSRREVERLMKSYRREEKRLKKYKTFETLS